MRSWLLLAFLCACSKASDSTNPLPKLPPPPGAAPPAALSIPVEIDGKAAPAIDAARLASLKPDFQDGEHRAWKLTSLLGAHQRFAVTGDADVTVEFRASAEEVPVLALTRRGEMIAALVDPANPFPGYHDQGRRMHRPGDPLVRIGGLKKIRVLE